MATIAQIKTAKIKFDKLAKRYNALEAKLDEVQNKIDAIDDVYNDAREDYCVMVDGVLRPLLDTRFRALHAADQECIDKRLLIRREFEAAKTAMLAELGIEDIAR